MSHRFYLVFLYSLFFVPYNVEKRIHGSTFRSQQLRRRYVTAVLWSSLFYQLLVPLKALKSNLYFQSNISLFIYSFYFCIFVCVHMHVVYVHICVQVCAHVCALSSERILGALFYHSLFYSIETRPLAKFEARTVTN